MITDKTQQILTSNYKKSQNVLSQVRITWPQHKNVWCELAINHGFESKLDPRWEITLRVNHPEWKRTWVCNIPFYFKDKPDSVHRKRKHKDESIWVLLLVERLLWYTLRIYFEVLLPFYQKERKNRKVDTQKSLL